MVKYKPFFTSGGVQPKHLSRPLQGPSILTSVGRQIRGQQPSDAYQANGLYQAARGRNQSPSLNFPWEGGDQNRVIVQVLTEI